MIDKIVLRLLSFIGLMILAGGEAWLAFFGSYGCSFSEGLGGGNRFDWDCDFALSVMWMFVVVAVIMSFVLPFSVRSSWSKTTKIVLWTIYCIAVFLFPVMTLLFIIK